MMRLTRAARLPTNELELAEEPVEDLAPRRRYPDDGRGAVTNTLVGGEERGGTVRGEAGHAKREPPGLAAPWSADV